MKMNENFIKTKLGEETLLVAIGEEAMKMHGIVRMNETAAFIVDQLSSNTTEEAIVSALEKEYDVKHSTAKEHVRKILDQLQSIGALID